ncbi:hypothetical protein Q8F55_006594 [Vanrija albida]|uniref:Proline iminopeptidase n=1 Tax=Vanrija albida TaxID=181172 RepID=A0ABR3PYK2_9TREE
MPTPPLTPKAAYPASAPFDSQTLKVSDLHTVFWQAGNPNGKPGAHGGPGGGTGPDDTIYFDPKVYRIVLIDQRGAGRSEPTAELRENTTWDLVADIERVREKLGIAKWLVFGGSWGSTLSLAYAQTHPDRTAALVLRGIFLLRKSELQWFYQDGASHIWPEAFEPYHDHIAPAARSDLISAYYKLLTSDDNATSLAAANAWATWEESTSKLYQDPVMVARATNDPKWSRAFARIECHYFVNNGFFPDGHLISQAQLDKVRHIPIIVVQGRYDCVCPARSAYDLKKAWGDALRLYIVDDAGHSAHEAGITKLLVAATDEFGGSVQW